MKVIILCDTIGVKKAQLDYDECNAKTKRVLNGVNTLEITYVKPKFFNKAEFFIDNAEVRIYNTETESNEYYKIIAVKDNKIGDKVIYTVVCASKLTVIANNEVINTTLELTDVLPSEAMDKILAYSTFSKGTINPTSRITLKLEYQTVMQGIQKICELTNSYYSLNGSAVDILSTSGSNNYVRLTTDLNIKSLNRDTNFSTIKNKIFGVGGGTPVCNLKGTPHKATQAITIPGGDTLHVEDYLIPEDDYWNNYYVQFLTGNEARGTHYKIIDCDASASTLTLDTLIIIEKYDMFCITDSSGNEIDYVFDGDADKEGIYINSNLMNTINLLKNSDMTNFTGGDADNWTSVGSVTRTKETSANYVKIGVNSQKVVCSSTTDYTGLKQKVIHNNPNNYFTIQAQVYIVSGGTVYLGLTNTNANSELMQYKATSSGWHKLHIRIYNTDNDMTVYVIGKKGTTFYLDNIMLEQDFKMHKFRVVSDKVALWKECQTFLNKSKTGRILYNINFFDLYNYDRVRYPHLKVALGDTVKVVDDVLNIETELVIVEQTEDIFSPENIQNVLSNE